MKFLFAILCLFLAHDAYCTSVSIKPVIRVHFEELSREHLRDLKEGALSFLEELVAELLWSAGREFCTGIPIDWERAMRMSLERGKEIDIEGETLCALIRNHIDHVFEPLTTTLDQCGRSQHSGPLGSTIVTAIKSFVKHVCSINGDQIIELVNLCAFEGTFTAPECDQFKQGVESLRPGNTTKTFVDDVCDLLPLARDCFMDQISQECKLEFTKKAWEDLINSVLTPCNLRKL